VVLAVAVIAYCVVDDDLVANLVAFLFGLDGEGDVVAMGKIWALCPYLAHQRSYESRGYAVKAKNLMAL